MSAGILVLLEPVVALVPVEERVNDRLDLFDDLLLHFLRGAVPELDDSPTETVARFLHGLGSFRERVAIDHTLPNQKLTEAIGLDVRVGENHGALAEVNPFARFCLR